MLETLKGSKYLYVMGIDMHIIKRRERLTIWRQIAGVKKNFFFCGGEPVRVTVLQFCFDKKKSCFFATPAIWREIVSRTLFKGGRFKI